MGTQIVKQPDGMYAIWSSTVDNFTAVDCKNAEEIADVLTLEFRQDCVAKATATIAKLDRGERPYCQFTMTFDECVKKIRDIHGNDADILSRFGLQGGDT